MLRLDHEKTHGHSLVSSGHGLRFDSKGLVERR